MTLQASIALGVVTATTMLALTAGVGEAADTAVHPTITRIHGRALNERPSRAVSSALRRSVIEVDDVGDALQSNASIIVRARANFIVDGHTRRAVAVEFKGRSGSRCWGVVVQQGKDFVPFGCEPVDKNSFYMTRVNDHYVLLAGRLRGRVESIRAKTSFGCNRTTGRCSFVWLTSRAETNALPLNSDGTRYWVVPIRARTFPVSLVFRDRAGEIVLGHGQVCVSQPGLCRP